MSSWAQSQFNADMRLDQLARCSSSLTNQQMVIWPIGSLSHDEVTTIFGSGSGAHKSGISVGHRQVKRVNWGTDLIGSATDEYDPDKL